MRGLNEICIFGHSGSYLIASVITDSIDLSFLGPFPKFLEVINSEIVLNYLNKLVLGYDIVTVFRV